MHFLKKTRQETKKKRRFRIALNCILGIQKINRQYLLSPFVDYHRLRKLNFRVRDGNGCDLSDMTTGSTLDDLFARPRRIQW